MLRQPRGSHPADASSMARVMLASPHQRMPSSISRPWLRSSLTEMDSIRNGASPNVSCLKVMLLRGTWEGVHKTEKCRRGR